MAVSLPVQALKQQLVRELGAARAQMGDAAVRAREEYRPLAIASRSFTNHTLWWVAGGVVAGLILVRVVLPAKNRSDISAKSARTRGISSMIRSGLLAYAQRAAVNYVKDHLPEKFIHEINGRIQSLIHRYGPHQ